MNKSPKNPSFKDIVTSVEVMDNDEQVQLFNLLREQLFGGEFHDAALAVNIRERRFLKGVVCLHCDSVSVVKNGKPRGKQRYMCKACDKTFGDTSATPLGGTRHGNKWIDYFDCMVKGKSIRESAKLVGISVRTSFFWRHKILNAVKNLPAPQLEGILEVDETFMRHSEKGSRNIVGRDPRKRGGKAAKRGISKEQDCIVVAVDRAGHSYAVVGSQGRISRHQAMAVFDGIVKDVTALCSDAHSTWQAFAKTIGVDHVELNGTKGERTKKIIYHIQNVNNFHRRWKGWMNRFQGVASKFLNNYLAWFCFLEAHKRETDKGARNEFLLAACMSISRDTFKSIRQTEFKLPA